jgi:hypothetical protein
MPPRNCAGQTERLGGNYEMPANFNLWIQVLECFGAAYMFFNLTCMIIEGRE